MSQCETKKILRNGEMVIINTSDFDPKVHKEWVDEQALKAEAEANRIIEEAKKGVKK